LEVPLDVGQLHDQYADFVWRSLQRLGIPRASLEDALQDVFIVVQRRLDSFDSTTKMTTWLFGICLRVAAAHRRRAYHRREEQVAELKERPDEHPLSNPEQAAIRHEARRQLERGLDALDLERRAVFVMFEIDRIPATAISEMLGIPVGTVYSRLHRARADFSAAIARLERTLKVGGTQ
jgi:RNA polymerase sigma-70 factor (ECF subfamily)